MARHISQVAGPEPSGRLDVLAKSIEQGFEWQGHRIAPWEVLSRTDARSRCELCAAPIWATSRKGVPAWSEVPGICPHALGVPAILRPR